MRIRRTRYLQWVPDPLTPGLEDPKFGIYKPPRARAVYLLRILAEIEHSLMVQYLFAAWSLVVPDAGAPDRNRIKPWQSTILEIAREEMGHLATLQNLMTLIGGPVSFARQDYPADSELYPFKFELEPLTKCSLGKYVLSEMPSDEIVSKLAEQKLLQPGEIDEIRRRVGAAGTPSVHRVGRLYDCLSKLFQTPAPGASLPGAKTPFVIPSLDIQADSIAYQVLPSEWGLGYDDLLILSAANSGDASTAITQISTQGEGDGITNDFMRSHFGKFLSIYRAFPDFPPSLPLAHNPTIDPTNALGTPIKNKEAGVWARLFNLRYRMLLMFLIHSFAIETRSAAPSTKGLLISFAFGEMYHLRSLGKILMQMPLEDHSGKLAGPPFEMPETLDFPLREADRWRLHRDLILASQHYVDKLLRNGNQTHKVYLEGLRTTNTSALSQANALVGA